MAKKKETRAERRTREDAERFARQIEAMAEQSDWHRVLYAVEPKAEIPRLRLTA